MRVLWIAPAGFIVAFVAVPLWQIAVNALHDDALQTLLSGSTWHVAALAAAQALLSTVLAMAVGLPLAAVTCYRFPGRALTRALLTIPFVMPTVVVALALRSMLGGALPTGIVAVVIAHAWINVAVVVRVVGSQWARMDLGYLHAARCLGASRLQGFRTITVPFLRPAIASSATVVFIFCFTSLGIVLLLGDQHTKTLEEQILRQTSVLLDLPAASALALAQLLVVSVALILGARAISTTTYRPTTAALRPLPASTGGRVALFSCAGLGAIGVLAPVISLVIASVSSAHGMTWQWWATLNSVDAGTTRIGSPIAALGISIQYALITGVLASIIGVIAAISLLGPRIGRWIAGVSILPLGISAATLGLGLLLAYARPPIDLRGTGLLVPLAHSLVAVPLVVAVVIPAVRSLDGRRLGVARSLGAAPTRAFVTAYGPTLAVVMVAAGGLAAAVSLGEFGAASFLARPGTPTVPLQIVRLLGKPGEQPLAAAAALSVILAALTLTLVLLVDRLGRRVGA